LSADSPGDGESSVQLPSEPALAPPAPEADLLARLPEDPRKIWLAFEPPDDPPLRAKHRLVQQLHQMIETVYLLDTSECPAGELDALASSVAEIGSRAAPLPSLREKGGPTASPGYDASLLERSGITGRSNPVAPTMQVSAGEGGRIRAWATYGAMYEGPPGCLHGGFIAAAFDDLMGMAQIASGRAGYTGTLTVKMRRPTPLYQRIDYEAWLDRAEGRKIWVKATSKANDVLLAEAEILFIAPRAWNISEEPGRSPLGSGDA
jgi:acyl-coenzyme A thioesterase PaaI-like protein